MKFSIFTTTAIEAAKAGGDVLMRYYRRPLKIDYKGVIDPVTQADRLSQKAVRSLLRRAFPGHGFIGEENLSDGAEREYCWIIDPLDGTVNFIHRLPVFSVSLGLRHHDEIIAGVVYAPAMNELFVAEKDRGAWLNGKRIAVSREKRLISSLIVTGFPYDIHRSRKRVVDNLVNVMLKAEGIRRLGSAAIDLAYVAAGRFEAFWEEGLKPWDVAAGSLMVSEAGGKVTDYDGGNDFLNGRTLLASNGTLHQAMLKLVSSKGADR